ncbi:Dihydrofolate synthase @ Folylpolyglutamate synthase [hydrothermal vent metagenome]|uniref:tetrahydrofolate synthase n=1 Tax=hydrothermal vent metagenome TaxID=652676 RepID=A0A3B1AGQ1_9ZZZZ
MKHHTDQILARLQKHHPKKIDLSLNRMHDLLARLDHPERKLPPVIHIAGTNGKGSTIAYLRAILEAAGLCVHVYTSPHLVRFAERIRLGGKLIGEDHLLKILLDCEKVNGGRPITYFEITTAIALKSFAESAADILLLEVGLGGRLDATNVVDHPLSTIITPISMDHQQFLGDTISAIAHEKAGIAKLNVPLIMADQLPAAKAAILTHGKSIGAKPVCYGDWTITETRNGFDYLDVKGIISLPQPNLHGPHQIANAGLAIACLRHQDKFTISIDHIKKGITSASWPARLQDISQSPYGHLLPKGSQLWLDGGHNPAAGEILADYFSKDRDRPLYLICGMLTAKDAAGFLKPLSSFVTKFYGITVIGEDCYSAGHIAEIAQQAGMDSHEAISVENALQKIKIHSQGRAVRTLICGSLYLAGHILEQNGLLPT